MASLAVSVNYLVLSSASETTVIDKSSVKPKKTSLTFPKQCAEIKKNGKCDSDDSDSGRVILKISPSEKYIAVCSGKKLSVWLTKDWTLLNCRDIVRAASNIIFTSSEKYIVLADKSGDVYKFNTLDDELGKLVLGHLSVVLDVLVTKDEKYIITCDRDEKIRISNFPNSYNIHCFCLGHKEFVSSLKFLPHDESILTSGSGDGTIKFWHFLEGLELFSFQLNSLPSNSVSSEDKSSLAVGIISVFKRNDKSSLVLFSVPQEAKMFVLLVESNNDNLLCNYKNVVELKTEPIIFDLSHSYLWILSGETVAQLSMLKWSDEENKFIDKQCLLDNLLTDIDGELEKLTVHTKLESIDYLYKKKYDNVQEYLVKKKARIEGSL